MQYLQLCLCCGNVHELVYRCTETTLHVFSVALYGRRVSGSHTVAQRGPEQSHIHKGGTEAQSRSKVKQTPGADKTQLVFY